MSESSLKIHGMLMFELGVLLAGGSRFGERECLAAFDFASSPKFPNPFLSRNSTSQRPNLLHRPTRVMAEAGVSAGVLKGRIEQLLQTTYVEIEDMSGWFHPAIAPPFYTDSSSNSNSMIGGCGQAYSAIIVSPLFEKKTTLARHRLVNTALKVEVAAIHAWTPKCFTPEQWEKKRESEVAPGKNTTGEVVNGVRA